MCATATAAPRVARSAAWSASTRGDRQGAGRFAAKIRDRLARGRRRVRAVAEPVGDEHRGSCRAAARSLQASPHTVSPGAGTRDAADLKAAVDRRPAARARSRSAPPRRPRAASRCRSRWTGAAPRRGRCPGCRRSSSRPAGSGRRWPCPGRGRARAPRPRRPAPSTVPQHDVAAAAVLDQVGRQLGDDERQSPGRRLVEVQTPGEVGRRAAGAPATWLASRRRGRRSARVISSA